MSEHAWWSWMSVGWLESGAPAHGVQTLDIYFAVYMCWRQVDFKYITSVVWCNIITNVLKEEIYSSSTTLSIHDARKSNYKRNKAFFESVYIKSVF